jgi:hypothetical protein
MTSSLAANAKTKEKEVPVGTRAQYSDETKREVYLLYPLCLTREDRIDLADELGIESLAKLYNLGSRLDATRGHEIDADAIYFDSARLSLRDDPADLEWLPKHDRYIRNAWRHLHIEKVAFRLRRSEIAVAYRARHLGRRNVCYYWDANKVIEWLGISGRDLIELGQPRTDRSGKPLHTLELLPCRDRHGRYKIMLVSTTSMARVFAQNGYWKTLVDANGADRFFIKEVMEGVTAVQLTQELQQLRERIDEGGKLSKEERAKMRRLDDLLLGVGGETMFEPSVWVSHGHTSLNPLSENTFGWFFDPDADKGKMIGFDRDPHDLAAEDGESNGGFDYSAHLASFDPEETAAVAAEL